MDVIKNALRSPPFAYFVNTLVNLLSGCTITLSKLHYKNPFGHNKTADYLLETSPRYKHFIRL